jgi:hypothetical protein
MPPRLRSRSWRAIACAASISPADKAAGVDVDGGHRLGLVDDQVAARLEVDAPAQRAQDFFFHAIQVEQRPLAGVVVQPWQHAGRVGLAELLQVHIILARVDLDGGRLFVHEVAQHALRQAQVLMQQRGGRPGARAVRDRGPGLAQVFDVAGDVGIRCIFGLGADDVAAFFFLRQQALQTRAQRLALRLFLDFLRYPDMPILRQIHQHASGDRDLRRQACALGADRVLDHLHRQHLAVKQQLFDRRRRGIRAAIVRARLPDVGDVQEGRPFQADVDKGRLHAGQHPHYLAGIDIAGQAARQRAFYVQFLHGALHDQGDAGFLRCDVNQDIFVHAPIIHGRLRGGKPQSTRRA